MTAATDRSEDAADELDLRILTPGLTDEEIAAVTSVVAAMIEEQQHEPRGETAASEGAWRRSVGELRPPDRGRGAWSRSAR